MTANRHLAGGAISGQHQADRNRTEIRRKPKRESLCRYDSLRDFIRETAIYGKREFYASEAARSASADAKEALEGLLDTELPHGAEAFQRDAITRIPSSRSSCAEGAGIHRPAFMVDRILHTPMYYIGDPPDFFLRSPFTSSTSGREPEPARRRAYTHWCS